MSGIGVGTTCGSEQYSRGPVPRSNGVQPLAAHPADRPRLSTKRRRAAERRSRRSKHGFVQHGAVPSNETWARKAKAESERVDRRQLLALFRTDLRELRERMAAAVAARARQWLQRPIQWIHLDRF